MERKILFVSFVVMFLMLSLGFAQLPGQEPGPVVDELYTVKIVDPSAAVAALKVGEVDMTEVPTLSDVEGLKALGFKVFGQSVQQLEFYLNLKRSVMSDVRFRRAIAHLLPKEAVLEDLWGPMGAYEYNHVPSVFVKWYNPNVPDYSTFDPDVATFMLDEAGYTTDPDGWRIDPATGTKMRELQIVTLGDVYGVREKAFCERWQEEMVKAGIPARVEYTDFVGALWFTKIHVERDFDAFLIGWGFSRPDITGYANYWVSTYAYNWAGYNCSEYDEQVSIYSNTLNETEAILAAYKIQEILARDVPGITVARPVAQWAMNPDLLGWAPSPFWYNLIPQLRWHWKDGVGGSVRIRLEYEAGTLIHGFDVTIFTHVLTLRVCDMLFDYVATTGAKVPLIAEDWKMEPWSDPGIGVANGSKITFWLRDDLYWHDGVKFTASDIEFAAKYGYDNTITYVPMHRYNFVDANAVSETQVELYFNSTSLFLLDDIANYPFLTSYPKHLYNPNATRYGLPEGPMGLQEAGKPGVPDPSKFAGPLTPHPDPPADKPWLTCFIGVGPWILRGYEWGVGYHLVANRDYYMTVIITDVNFDKKVNILDISSAAKSFGADPDHTRWDPIVDINGDNVINIIDIASLAKDFGKSY